MTWFVVCNVKPSGMIWKKNKFEKVEIVIEEHEILFPNGYFFKHSDVNQFRKVDAQHVSEINLKTYPPSLIYRSQEIIFLKQELEQEIESFAQRNEIPIIERLDIWEHVNRPYVDTEFEKEEIAESMQLLSENGISKSELRRIRRKVVWTMFVNFFALEWIYLGLFDYLYWTFLTKRKYWWAMEIGLRSHPLKDK